MSQAPLVRMEIPVGNMDITGPSSVILGRVQHIPSELGEVNNAGPSSEFNTTRQQN